MVLGGGFEVVFGVYYCIVVFGMWLGLFEVKLGIMFGVGGI